VTELRDRLAAVAAEPVRALDLNSVGRRAKRLRRRTRALGATGAATVVAVAVIVGSLLVGGHSTRSHVDTVAPPVGSVSTLPISNGVLHGRYAMSNVAFGDASTGLVTIDGSPSIDSNGPSAAWVEASGDGGRSWTATQLGGGTRRAATATNVTFVDATRGWAYNGHGGGLFATDDAGATWTSQLPGRTVTMLATAGLSAWVLASSPCATCDEQLYTTAAPGAPLQLVADQLPGKSILHLVRPTPTTAAALISPAIMSAKDPDPFSLVVTEDGGRDWSTRTLPCVFPAHSSGGPGLLTATSSQDLWLLCQGPSMSMDTSEALSVIYRSADQGRTWQRVTPEFTSTEQAITKGLFDDVAALDPVGGRVVWALETDNEAGNGPVMRSTNEGRTWDTVLPRTLRKDPLGISALTVISATTAWVSAFAYTSPTGNTSRPVLLHTTNGGSTWTTEALPVPTDVSTPTR
jgi:photosystem II stability/assembly factor-like uncharacterized protein